MPLAEILATCRKNVSNTGPRAAGTPVKYECDSRNLTCTFARSKILLTEKLTNGALVTPTPEVRHQSIMAIWQMSLTHWGRVTHIWVTKIAIIGSDNGLLPGRRQAIIWTNAGILLTGPLGTNFSGILIEIHSFSFKKLSSAKWRPCCCSLNVLN